MHQFFGCFSHLRPDLMEESIEVPENCSPEQFQWAVFCAASVEYLCKKYDLLCPEWALNPRYSSEAPWFYAIGADPPTGAEKTASDHTRAIYETQHLLWRPRF